MSAVTVREQRGAEGFRDIGVYRDGKLIAAISRPMSGCKWFLHLVGRTSSRGIPYATRKAAIEAASQEKHDG